MLSLEEQEVNEASEIVASAIVVALLDVTFHGHNGGSDGGQVSANSVCDVPWLLPVSVLEEGSNLLLNASDAVVAERVEHGEGFGNDHPSLSLVVLSLLAEEHDGFVDGLDPPT